MHILSDRAVKKLSDMDNALEELNDSIFTIANDIGVPGYHEWKVKQDKEAAR